MRCPSCMSERIIKGSFKSASDIFFVPEEEQGELKSKAYPVEVYVCETCGMIVNFVVKDMP